jgi:hypothetical protein
MMHLQGLSLPFWLQVSACEVRSHHLFDKKTGEKDTEYKEGRVKGGQIAAAVIRTQTLGAAVSPFHLPP